MAEVGGAALNKANFITYRVCIITDMADIYVIPIEFDIIAIN